MRALWAAPRALPGCEVTAMVGDPKPALTTVLTTLERLRGKALVSREREGRVYVYRAVVAREHLVAVTMLAALEDSADRGGALTRFVEEVAPQDLTALRQALARRDTQGPAEHADDHADEPGAVEPGAGTCGGGGCR